MSDPHDKLSPAQTAMFEQQQRIAIAHAEAQLAITTAQGAVHRLAAELHGGAADAWRLAQVADDRAVEMSAWVDRARDKGCRGLSRALERSFRKTRETLAGWCDRCSAAPGDPCAADCDSRELGET